MTCRPGDHIFPSNLEESCEVSEDLQSHSTWTAPDIPNKKTAMTDGPVADEWSGLLYEIFVILGVFLQLGPAEIGRWQLAGVNTATRNWWIEVFWVHVSTKCYMLYAIYLYDIYLYAIYASICCAYHNRLLDDAFCQSWQKNYGQKYLRIPL